MAYAVATMSGAGLLLSVVVAAFFLYFLWWSEAVWHGAFMRPLNERIAGISKIVAVCGMISYVCWRVTKKACKAAKRLPYVPPITFSTLPAEEVLVRGAAEPSAPSETLLRAGVKSEETKPTDLLRATTGLREP
jgi:hypothetical protein